MRRLRTLIWILFFLVLPTLGISKNLQVQQQENEPYWISYSASGSIFLIKIDSTGTIVEGPKLLLENVTSPTSLSSLGADKINLWFHKKDGFVYRDVLNKETLESTKIVKTSINTQSNNYLKVTHKTQNNFLVVNQFARFGGSPSLAAFGISPTGSPNEHSWEVSSDHLRCDYSCSGGISSDATTVFWIADSAYHVNLFFQSLGDSGRTNGNVKEATKLDNFASNVVISDTLPGNRRYILLQDSGGMVNHLSLLVFSDTANGPVLIERVPLAEKNGQAGDIAIEPSGSFVLFSVKNNKGEPLLFFQALDTTGHPAGAAKVLVRKVLPEGIDILKERELAKLTLTVPSSYPSRVGEFRFYIDGVFAGSGDPGSRISQPVSVGFHSIDGSGGYDGSYECTVKKVFVPSTGLTVSPGPCVWD